MTIALRRADLEPNIPASAGRLEDLLAPQLTTRPKPRRVDVGIHPVAVAIPVAAAIWFVVKAWLAFGGGETNIVLGVIAVFCLLYLGLFVGGAAKARGAYPEQAPRRSFLEFLHGEVDIYTGYIKGSDAFWQIVTMPLAFAIGFTIIAIIAILV